MIWNVQVAKDDFTTVKADTVDIEDGCLVFRNVREGEVLTTKGHIILALAYDQWITLHSDEDGRAALEKEAEEALKFRRPSFDYVPGGNDEALHSGQDRGRIRRIRDWMRS